MTVMVPIRALGLSAAVVASSFALRAQAEDASPWQRDGHSAVRLLAGSRSGAVLLGGIAFQLEPGWKTYWRNPGDSGVPAALRLLQIGKYRSRDCFVAGAEKIRRWRGRSLTGLS